MKPTAMEKNIMKLVAENKRLREEIEKRDREICRLLGTGKLIRHRVVCMEAAELEEDAEKLLGAIRPT